MNKNLLPYLLFSLIACLALNGCSEKVEKVSEYTHVIPTNASEVCSINIKELVRKSGISEMMGEETRQRLTSILLENGNGRLSEQLKPIFEKPEESGIDWDMPAYLFNASSLRKYALTLKVNNLPKLQQLIQALAEAKLCTTPQKNGIYSSTELKDLGVLLAYNNGTLLIVYTGSSLETAKLQPAITALMKQNSEQSIQSNPHFKKMMQQKGDVRLLSTPDMLPMDIRSVLKWPYGTQLIGYLTFENGRIYAMLQQADFNGETQESSQPFHPANSRELQQSMMQLSQGYPFNIELTTEELLTLSNLRVMKEFAPESSEVNALYQLITEIETLNLRGDSNRTTFTVILNDKKRNALKQLVEFGKAMVGLF